MENKFASKFIVLDGPDGCGKSTQAELLTAWLEQHNVDVVTFRDPGTTAIGEKIRQILLNPEHHAMDTRTELSLYMAARAQLWAEKIAPALKDNKCVVLDRWLSSTCAYQGYAGQFGMDKVIAIATDSLERPWPDITVILDIDLQTASTRLNQQLDRMEQKGDNYHQKVRDGFLALAEKRDDFTVVNAADDIQTVHENVMKAVENI
ncbi:MAG: dTMP kinase [Planctomycetes bacterium]|nr:dTMP kinase [Planctomycetota bacterium]